ncbi:hypothetical protein IGI96_003510 [Enterococcus sp. DIV0421]
MKEKIIIYSIQIAMLKKLFIAKQITTKEYELAKKKIAEKYNYCADIFS